LIGGSGASFSAIVLPRRRIASRTSFPTCAYRLVLAANVLASNLGFGLSNSEFIRGELFHTLPIKPVLFFSDSTHHLEVEEQQRT
jgi:hypothetical protein